MDSTRPTDQTAPGRPGDTVVVAVGAEGAAGAVAFAVQEAERHHAPVHVVHVVRAGAANGYPELLADVYAAADDTVSSAVRLARDLGGPGTVVTGERLDSGGLVHDLVDQGRGGALLVLERRTTSRLHHVLTRSTLNGVAARAAVPVASVPTGWRRPPAGAASVVTVGVQDAGEAEPLLRTAFELARERGSSLRVVHSWWARGLWSPVIDTTVRADWEGRARRELEGAVEPLRAGFPEVPVVLHVRPEPPVEALLDAAGRSGLVVVGRRHHLLPVGSHLGPVARAVLDHATCPVLIAPEAVAPRRSRTRRAPATTGG
ncbi:universal stress protein [Nocardioides sp. Leaf374]|uniref:universal stress protein n=1 Tax=Nocardioides sp. Leaf374 TaxID=2876560 RepID=UPI001E30E94D|nr:universal stress protein [Nocardioides sp. Leaf374]